jgi:hypothetical protein
MTFDRIATKQGSTIEEYESLNLLMTIYLENRSRREQRGPTRSKKMNYKTLMTPEILKYSITQKNE